MEKNNKLNETMKKLEQGILEVFDSKKYKNYLKVCSKFHHYSYNNQILIYTQNPNATFVKGFASWKKDFQRTVKKVKKE